MSPLERERSLSRVRLRSRVETRYGVNSSVGRPHPFGGPPRLGCRLCDSAAACVAKIKAIVPAADDT